MPPTERWLYAGVGVRWIIWYKLAVTPPTMPALLCLFPISSLCSLLYARSYMHTQAQMQNCEPGIEARTRSRKTSWPPSSIRTPLCCSRNSCRVFAPLCHSRRKMLILPRSPSWELRLYRLRIIYWPWLKSMSGFGHFALNLPV